MLGLSHPVRSACHRERLENGDLIAIVQEKSPSLQNFSDDIDCFPSRHGNHIIRLDQDVLLGVFSIQERFDAHLSNAELVDRIVTGIWQRNGSPTQTPGDLRTDPAVALSSPPAKESISRRVFCPWTCCTPAFYGADYQTGRLRNSFTETDTSGWIT